MSCSAGRVRSLAILLSVAGSLLTTASSSAWAVSRGQLDTRFGSNGFALAGSDTRLLGTAVQSDGKIVAVGAIGTAGNNVRLLVVRFTSTGALDPSFSGGKVTGPAAVIGRGVAIQRDGKIVVVGQSTDATGATMNGIVVERFTSSGAPDGSFGSGGVARVLTGDPSASGNAVALQPDGRIVVGGSGTIQSGPNSTYQGAALARFNTNGSLDGSFGSGGVEVADLGRFSVANGLALQPDGKIVVGGSLRTVDLQVTVGMAARFNSNGALDGGFASSGEFIGDYRGGGGTYTAFNGIALQPDGKMVLVGATLTGTGINALFVRLSSGGAPDGSFGSGGVTQLPASDTSAPPPTQPRFIPYAAEAVTISQGGIVATGWFWHLNHVKELAVWGLTSAGTPDGGFGTGGRTLTNGPTENTGVQGNGIAVRPDGSFAVAGEYVAAPFAPPGIGFAALFAGKAIAIPLKATLSAPRTAKIHIVIINGLGVTVGCNQACTARVALVVSARDARRLGLRVRGGRPVVIATSGTTLRSAGTGTVLLRLSRAVARGLNKLRSLTASLQGSFTTTGQRPVSVSTRVTFVG